MVDKFEKLLDNILSKNNSSTIKLKKILNKTLQTINKNNVASLKS